MFQRDLTSHLADSIEDQYAKYFCVQSDAITKSKKFITLLQMKKLGKHILWIVLQQTKWQEYLDQLRPIYSNLQ